MSSLWTPDGEVPVERRPRGDAAPAADEGPASTLDEGADAGNVLGGLNLDDLSPEEREQAEQIIAEMAETQRRLAGMPAADVVANHAMGLYELGAIHLSQPTPQLADAAVAIDALAAVVSAVGDRFGENLPVLRNALSNLQAGFVEIKNRTEGPDAAAP